MTSTKRWHEIYSGENPLSLPQSIARRLRAVHRHSPNEDSAQLKYLWLYVSEEGAQDGGIVLESKGMDAPSWLNVIDEAASLGADSVIFTVGRPIAGHPEVFEIAQWAQTTHEMNVGIHLCECGLGDNVVALAKNLDRSRTAFFVEASMMNEATVLEREGFRVFPSKGQDQTIVHPTCHLPETMACMGARGNMYTCGLVLGDKTYYMGNYGDRPLEATMEDANIPHIVPEGLPKTHRGCNGCPPLMYRRMNGENI